MCGYNLRLFESIKAVQAADCTSRQMFDGTWAERHAHGRISAPIWVHADRFGTPIFYALPALSNRLPFSVQSGMTAHHPLGDELLFTPADHTYCMAMPADFGDDNSGASASMYSEDESERTDDVNEYRRICIDFIEDIQHDYEAWVDYYKLPAEEDSHRRSAIHAAVKQSCEWIAKVAQSIKSVDIAMNDGLQKMAEATAGRPLEIGVFVNKMSGYAEARAGMIKVTARASARPDKKITIGSHFKDAKFRVDSTCGAYLTEESPGAADGVLSADLILHAENAERRDLISFTVTFVEVDGSGLEIEKRGLTTIVHIV